MIGSSVLIEIVGWIGAAVLLAAYGFVSYGLLDARSRIYQTLNLVAGLLLGANSVWHRAWPSAAVNIIWSLIAVGALAVAAAPRRAAPEDADPRA
ncbi:MAG TPA: hypothetical protein VGN43_20370 [Steroidobacteraceae bacterium]|jgi:hypothetical protein|nr:hypothetical protein [Steroidobacteraceae bacterium]